MKYVNLLKYAVAGVGLIGVGERLAEGSEIDGPQAHSEVFYVSVNNHETGEKQDDRIGDAFLLLALAGTSAVIIGKLRETE
jgi:hypothetical protein